MPEAAADLLSHPAKVGAHGAQPRAKLLSGTDAGPFTGRHQEPERQVKEEADAWGKYREDYKPEPNEKGIDMEVLGQPRANSSQNSLLATPQEADVLATADATARIRLTLRNPADRDTRARTPLSLDSVMRDSVPVPRKADTSKLAAAAN